MANDPNVIGGVTLLASSIAHRRRLVETNYHGAATWKRWCVWCWVEAGRSVALGPIKVAASTYSYDHEPECNQQLAQACEEAVRGSQ